MLRLYIILVTYNFEYASVVRNSIMTTDINKLERIQQIFAATCFNRFFPGAHYCYSLALEELKLHTLRMRRHRLNAIFITQVYFGFKFCISVSAIVGLRVPVRSIRDFAMFNVCSSSKNCPSARCASAANVVCRDVDVFVATNFVLNHFL
jgi:hypothetical protein